MMYKRLRVCLKSTVIKKPVKEHHVSCDCHFKMIGKLYVQGAFPSTRTPKLSGAKLIREVASLDIFIVLSICKSFCFTPFSRFLESLQPIFLLPPQFCRHSADPQFHEIVHHNQKSLRGFRKLSRRPTMTRP
jgi:hypothetical protein